MSNAVSAASSAASGLMWVFSKKLSGLILISCSSSDFSFFGFGFSDLSYLPRSADKGFVPDVCFSLASCSGVFSSKKSLSLLGVDLGFLVLFLQLVLARR